MNETTTITQGKYHISADTYKLWSDAAFTVKQSQKKFHRAYEATLTDALGEGWKERWRTDPNFGKTLNEVEDFMRDTCRSQDMSLTTFNKYRNAARKAALLNIPMNFGANFKLEEIRQAKEIATTTKKPIGEAFRDVRADRVGRQSKQLVSVDATVLPKPTKADNPTDYLDDLSSKLISHIREVKAKFGQDAAAKLCEQLQIVVYGNLKA